MSQETASYLDYRETLLDERARTIELSPSSEAIAKMLDRAIALEQNPAMSSLWEKRLRPQIANERLYHEVFHDGLADAQVLAQLIENGETFPWHDVKEYSRRTQLTRDVISAGQFVSVFGRFAVSAWQGAGPTMRFNHQDLFNGSPDYALNALSNATVTNFGDGYPPHMLATITANALTGGAKCPPYHYGPFMEQTARNLIALSPNNSEGGKVAFFNSGGDAVSLAITAAELYALRKSRNGSNGHRYENRKLAVFFKEAYHGNVEGRAGRVTSGINQVFLGDDQRGLELEYPNILEEVEPVLNQLKRAVNSGEVASIVMEATQGDGGGVEMCPEFFVEMAKLALDNDIPIIVDEVQAGFGRTGSMWAVDAHLKAWRESSYVQSEGYPENLDIIVAVAKSFTNGAVPGSAVMFPERYAVLERAMGLNTYSGHPTTLLSADMTMDVVTGAIPQMMGTTEMVGGNGEVINFLIQRNRRAFLDRLGDAVGPNRLIQEIRGRGLYLFLGTSGREFIPPALYQVEKASDSQLLQAECFGTKRVLVGTTARNSIRVHLAINAPEWAWHATGAALRESAEKIESGHADPVSIHVCKYGGVSGLASR